MNVIDMSALCVLIADPNPNMVKIIRAMLRGFGISRIQEAFDGAVALEAFKSHNIDIAVVDYALATLTGVELTEFLRGDESCRRQTVPVIMLSACTEKRRVEDARDAGVTEFLRKPLCARDLYARLLEVIENPRPFVRSGAYFGPDRRRQLDGNMPDKERRAEFLKDATKHAKA